jgi:hypothetical protein
MGNPRKIPRRDQKERLRKMLREFQTPDEWKKRTKMLRDIIESLNKP